MDSDPNESSPDAATGDGVATISMLASNDIVKPIPSILEIFFFTTFLKILLN
jgi:hypothetical protein